MNQKPIWDYLQNEGVELFANSIPRLKFIIHQAQTIFKKAGIKEAKVLNIGVGNGWLESQCVKKGWHTCSLDPSEVAIRKLEQAGVLAKVGYIESIPYDANLFDVVFCSEVLEHLSDEQLQLGLKEVKRVLVKGGYLIGTVPFNENLLDSQVVCPDCGKTFHRWGHLQSFDKIRITRTLEAANFKTIEVRNYAFPDFSRSSVKDKLKSIIRWILGRIGSPIAQPNLFFVAKSL